MNTFSIKLSQENTSSAGSRVTLLILSIVLILGFFNTPVLSETLIGEVVNVQSGDTFSIRDKAGNVLKVRLQEIDAPEMKQALGRQAQQYLSDLITDQTLEVDYEFIDRYESHIGIARLPDGRILNEEMVRAGLAWYYQTHQPENSSLRNLEYLAWKGRLGIWLEPQPTPPWKFRREIPIDSPSSSFSGLDYNHVFDFGLVGFNKTKTYLWPACGNFPKSLKGYVVFAHLSQAKKAGYQLDPSCKKTAK
jgi:endonuclease YncB( thermonuclease family)